MHLFIRGESNPRYDKAVITITEKHVIDTECEHTAEDLLKKIRKDSNVKDEIKFLHQSIPILKGSVKHSTWIHDIRMNVQEKFESDIKQILFSPQLCTCESEELKQRENVNAMISFMKL